MLTNIKGVLFDLDGTLVDSMWVWKTIDVEFLGKYQVRLPKSLQWDIEGMSFTETAEFFHDHFDIPLSVEEIKDCWNRMAMQHYSTDVPLKKGAKAFLEHLKEKNIKIGIASSNSIELIQAVLKANQVDAYFDAIVTSCEVKKGKPFPDVYLTAADKIGVLPEDCLVFEDLPAGIRAGIGAGMKVVAVEDEFSAIRREEKQKLADYYIQDYEDAAIQTLFE